MDWKDNEEVRKFMQSYMKEYRRAHPDFVSKQREKQRKRQRKYYRNNPKAAERNRAKSRVRAALMRTFVKKEWMKVKAWVHKELEEKCKNCGFSNPIALDVHHKNGRNKIQGDVFRRRVWYIWWKQGFIPNEKKVDLELLCANCHRILHFESVHSD